jgi:hypothetical protein
MVVLPEHLHCIWTLPDGDSDFHAFARRGFYPADWARDPDVTINGGE